MFSYKILVGTCYLRVHGGALSYLFHDEVEFLLANVSSKG